MPAISIIIPVFNVAPYLTACLDSVLAQTFRDFECLCVDDGSTDASPQILARYAQADRRLRILTRANGGGSAARNAGVKQAAGDFICFVDSDDYIHPQMLAALYGRMERAPVDIVACGFERVTNERTFTPVDLSRLVWKKVVSPLQVPFYRKVRLAWGCEPWRKLYRRELFENHLFDERLVCAHDIVFTTCLLRDVQTIAWTSAKLYYYRDVFTSISKKTFSEKRALSYLEGIRVMHDCYAQPENSHCLNLVRRTMIASSVDCLLNLSVRQISDPDESLRLFEYIQPKLQAMHKKGMVVYRGLKWRQKLVLFLLVNCSQSRPAYRAGQFLLKKR